MGWAGRANCGFSKLKNRVIWPACTQCLTDTLELPYMQYSEYLSETFLVIATVRTERRTMANASTPLPQRVAAGDKNIRKTTRHYTYLGKWMTIPI